MRIIRVENRWHSPIEIPHLGDKYVVPVGGSKIVPYEAAASLFGDPRARDGEKHKGRRELYDQVRNYWSFYLGYDSEQVWETEKCPQFDAFDVNTNEQVWFVIHDPDGATLYGSEPTVNANTTDQALLNAQITQLQSQVATLLAAMEARQGIEAPATYKVGPPEYVIGGPTQTPTVVAPSVVEAPVGGVDSELPPVPTNSSAPAKDSPRATPVSK
jgi:hypothetical protein